MWGWLPNFNDLFPNIEKEQQKKDDQQGKNTLVVVGIITVIFLAHKFGFLPW